MGRYRTGIETQRRILDATRRLLAEMGLEGTTLQAICTRAGVRAGSFYNLFESKEEAVLTVVREAIEAVDPDPDHVGRDTVADLIEAYIAFIEEQPALARVYIQIAVGGANTTEHLSGRVLRHHRRRAERFTEALQRDHPGLSCDTAQRRALLLLATLNGLALSSMVDPSFDFAGHARQLARTSTAASSSAFFIPWTPVISGMALASSLSSTAVIFSKGFSVSFSLSTISGRSPFFVPVIKHPRRAAGQRNKIC